MSKSDYNQNLFKKTERMGMNQLTKLKALGLVPKAESYPASISRLWASWTIGRTMPGWEPSHDSDPSLSRYSPHSCQHFWGHFLFSLLENMNACWIIMQWLCTTWLIYFLFIFKFFPLTICWAGIPTVITGALGGATAWRGHNPSQRLAAYQGGLPGGEPTD